MPKFEIFTRKNRFTRNKKSAGYVIAETKREAIGMFCTKSNNIWVSAKEVRQ